MVYMCTVWHKWMQATGIRMPLWDMGKRPVNKPNRLCRWSLLSYRQGTRTHHRDF